MPRRKTPPPPATEAPAGPAPPLVVHDDAVFLAADFLTWFRLRKSTLRRELKAGRLRVSKRAGRYYLLGRWVKEWLAGGELKKAGQGGGPPD